LSGGLYKGIAMFMIAIVTSDGGMNLVFTQ